MNPAATTTTAQTHRPTTAKNLRSKALKNIKRTCQINNNLEAYRIIKDKLIQREERDGLNLSLSFYRSFYNLSLNNF
jgi:phosphoribosylaminoimidazole carboxylase (NCAIR synthetase)